MLPPECFCASAWKPSLLEFFILSPLSSTCFISNTDHNERSQSSRTVWGRRLHWPACMGQLRPQSHSGQEAGAGPRRVLSTGWPFLVSLPRPVCGQPHWAASPSCTLSFRVPKFTVCLMLLLTQNVNVFFCLPCKFQCMGSWLIWRTGSGGHV